MPSASGRYQSRLFKFIYRQSQRLSDRVGETLRHAQVKAGWSLQSLFFAIVTPIHQAINNAGKQLNSAPSPKPQLNAGGDEIYPDSDTTILNVLGNARALSSYKHHALSTGLLKPTAAIEYVPHLRGIASQLADQSLVLVNSANEIINILTPQEQQKLRDKIISETAEYYTARQQFLAKTADKKCAIAQIDRLLIKLTGDTNTPNQPQLPPQDSEPKQLQLPPVKTSQPLAAIDAVLAKLENNAIVPVAQTTTSLVNKIRDQLQTLVYGNTQSQINPSDRSSNQITSQANPIQKFISTALNYVREIDPASVDSKSNQQQSQPNTLTVITNSTDQKTLEDPWLTANELFGQTIPIATIPITEATNQEAKPEPKQLKPPSQPVKLLQPEPIANPGIIPSTSVSILPDSPRQIKKTPVTSTTSPSKIQDTHRASNEFDCTLDIAEDMTDFEDLEFNQDWIEINASTVSYEKHPLEQILEWLDRLMAWLEAKLVRLIKSLWNWWQSRN